MVGFVFFFKQKTAYEMRISDWSSDVCSSDLSIDKRSNPVHLITDKLRERRCASFSPVFQQLSGSPDAGQWILYLMRQNSRRPHGGARTIGGSAVGNLLRLAVGVYCDHTPAFMVGDGRNHQVHLHPRRTPGIDMDIIGRKRLVGAQELRSRRSE